MKRMFILVLIVGGLLMIGLMTKMPTQVSPTSARADQVYDGQPDLERLPVMGGGTAVLFDNGDLYDLTLNGWVKSGHLPLVVGVKHIKVVLASNRIVELDGTG